MDLRQSDKSMKKVKGTKTSSFGVSKRENHDSTTFYNSRLYHNNQFNELKFEKENTVGNYLDKILCRDSRKLSKIQNSSIHLIVTSPPYNVGKEYDKNLNLNEYMKLLKSVFSECHRVLVPGGRACINIANVGRKPYIPYHKFIIDAMLDVGFLMRGEIIWDKGAGAGTSTAWGSWQSASNPTLRDTHEYILIFSKDSFARNNQNKQNTISKQEFLEFTKSVWRFSPERAQKVGHPAPFPVELPYRCIQLYTFKDEIVLDPFCGSGTTGIAALKSDRHFILIDNNRGYVRIAKKRIKEYCSQKMITQFSSQ